MNVTLLRINFLLVCTQLLMIGVAATADQPTVRAALQPQKIASLPPTSR